MSVDIARDERRLRWLTLVVEFGKEPRASRCELARYIREAFEGDDYFAALADGLEDERRCVRMHRGSQRWSN